MQEILEENLKLVFHISFWILKKQLDSEEGEWEEGRQSIQARFTSHEVPSIARTLKITIREHCFRLTVGNYDV